MRKSAMRNNAKTKKDGQLLPTYTIGELLRRKHNDIFLSHAEPRRAWFDIKAQAAKKIGISYSAISMHIRANGENKITIPRTTLTAYAVYFNVGIEKLFTTPKKTAT